MNRMRVRIDSLDGMMKHFQNRLAQVGQGKGRVAMARALNRGGKTTNVHVKRALVAQTSIPRSIVNATLKEKQASTSGGGALEFVIYGSGTELPLKIFKPKQMGFGTRAKVWGKMQRFPGAFMGPRPGVIAPSLGGHVFHRTGKSRKPIEKLYGPSIPKEMVIDQTARTFETTSVREISKRLDHELKRMMP